MSKSFNLPAGINWQSLWKEPRVTMRVVIGILLVANLVMAVLAFNPFGGSADDIARDQTAKTAQLSALTGRIRNTRQLVEKVEIARKAGDDFLARYFMNQQTTTSDIWGELQRIGSDSGVSLGLESFEFDDIEGSDNMKEMRISVGCEGNYQSLTKFVNLLDKSPRFLIVENIHANGVQNGQKVNVTFKIDTFTLDKPGAAS